MKKTQFVLSRKTQKGQVAIFVALIFQVVFVFFALLINVGLLVHHKINLQQSTDLAAYYGAMKQAESLNAIAHVNYQIRQAWKLLTWRYRVLGTFGFEKGDASTSGAPPGGGPIFPEFPLKLGGGLPAEINSSGADSGKCKVGSDFVNTADVPFFCIGHAGMKEWPGQRENNCRINCAQINESASTISKIPGVGNASTPFGGSVAGAVNAAIIAANSAVEARCNLLGPENLNLLGTFIANYYLEERARSKTLLMLAANLSKTDADKILDLDGNLVLDGVKKTLENNLTEANKVSVSNIKIQSGLSHSDCSVSNDPGTSAAKKDSKQFLKRIEFAFVQFYLHSCNYAGGANYKPTSIFNPSANDLLPGLTTNNTLKNLIMSLELVENEKFTVGYEKNPWCQEYYAVKAQSEPKIPFLPLSKIKLTAVSVAKPFGGSIGPWFGNEWKSGEKNTQDSIGVDTTKQTDSNLPIANPYSNSTMKDNAKIILNFARYVGDTEGLANTKYLAEFHSALLNRKPDSKKVARFGGAKNPDPKPGNQQLSEPGVWPALSSWKNTLDMDSSNYDPLMYEGSSNDSYLRDLEIAAIAPNQFDLTYYSIDPDFYNNYYKRLSNPSIFDKLKDSAGISPSSVSNVRPDFGNNKRIYPQMESFSVRNQIEVVKNIFENLNTGISGSSGNFLSIYPELATKQSSLLTGWTFSNLTDFTTFPSADVKTPDGTMSFGRCRDDWQGTDSAPEYKTPMDSNSDLPPTPGNCVTGGRVGYSVKLVSPSMLRNGAPAQKLGGPNTSGPILNPIPDSFFNF